MPNKEYTMSIGEFAKDERFWEPINKETPYIRVVKEGVIVLASNEQIFGTISGGPARHFMCLIQKSKNPRYTRMFPKDEQVWIEEPVKEEKAKKEVKADDTPADKRTTDKTDRSLRSGK